MVLFIAFLRNKFSEKSQNFQKRRQRRRILGASRLKSCPPIAKILGGGGSGSVVWAKYWGAAPSCLPVKSVPGGPKPTKQDRACYSFVVVDRNSQRVAHGTVLKFLNSCKKAEKANLAPKPCLCLFWLGFWGGYQNLRCKLWRIGWQGHGEVPAVTSVALIFTRGRRGSKNILVVMY